MEAVYGWVKSIIYYMIFLSVANNLLADSKYEKYVRFFAGMVLMLLVVGPLTGGLRLDEQISSLFQSITFQNDTQDLKVDLWGMEDKRLDQIIGRYEEAVKNDVTAMAEGEGLSCVRAEVAIDGDRNSSRYGQVTEIRLELDGERKGEEEDGYLPGSRPVQVEGTQINSIQVEAVTLGDEAPKGNMEEEAALAGGGREDGELRNGVRGNGSSGSGEQAAGTPDSEAWESGTAGGGEQAAGTPDSETWESGMPGSRNQEAGQPDRRAQESGTSGGKEPGVGTQKAAVPPSPIQSKVNGLTGKVADYYGLERSHVKIWWKND